MASTNGTSGPAGQLAANSKTPAPQPPQTATNTRRTKPATASWFQRYVWGVVRESVRLELSHQEYIFKNIYNRQPRHVGYFLLKLVDNLGWIPRFFIEWYCFLLRVITKFIIQCLDLAIVWALRALWRFPWAVALFLALIAVLATTPYAMWTTNGHGHSPWIWTSMYIGWLLRMSQLYIDQPEKWLGYTRKQHFPYLTLDEFVKGPYLLLGVGVAVFVHFEHCPIYAPLFLRY